MTEEADHHTAVFRDITNSALKNIADESNFAHQRIDITDAVRNGVSYNLF